MLQGVYKNNEEIRTRLLQLKEPAYQRFASALIPNIEQDQMIGVRLPALRTIAKQLARGTWREYLADACDDSFEERMLQGMTIGYVKAPLADILALTDVFLLKIDNWSVCDSFCAGLKIAKAYPDEMWQYVKQCLSSGQEYVIRFALVMMIFYYVDDGHVPDMLRMLDGIRHPSYYVKMAAAWAVSACYVYDPEVTGSYLNTCTIDDFTFCKSLQKIRESKKADAKMKEQVRRLLAEKKGEQ